MQHIINNTRYSFTGNNPPDCLLAIICVTYNHSRFIKQALESFFEQVTDFRFKILVFNDCSNDKTQEILHEAAAARKNIGVFNSSANLGAEQNFINALSQIDTEYAALCDGDDYWKDRLKLQKQIDALRRTPSATLCFHDVEVVNADGLHLGYFPDKSTAHESTAALVCNNFIQTNSVVYRWRRGAERILDANAVPLDWLLHLCHAEKGGIVHIPEVMAVYRKHDGGVWSSSWDVYKHRVRFGEREIRFFEILSTLFEGKYAESCATTQHEIFSSIFFSACYDSDFSTVARCLNQKSKAAIEYLNSIGVDLCQHDCSGQMVQESWLKEQIHNALSTTVVVTSYNQEKFIQDCLRSIISQRGVPFNIVLGDDCSSDETVRRAEAVLREAGAEYSILRQAVNAGMLNNLKRSLESASGKYIAICEGDDYWLSDRRLLKHILTLACNQDVGMTFNWILVDDEIRNVNYAHPQQATLRDGEILDSWQLLQDNVIGNFSACVYRSEVVREIPISYWSKAGAADWLFNIMITANKRAEFVRELLSVYRLHRSGQWSSLSPMERETAVSVARHEYSDLIGFDYDEMRNFLKLKFEFVCFHALSPPLVGVIDEVKPIYGSASDHRFAVCISGWVFSDCGEQLSLTVVGAGTCHDVSLSIERPDVVIHHAFEGDAVCSTLLCGFSFELPSNNIPINIFVKNGTDEVLWGAIRCISVDTLK